MKKTESVWKQGKKKRVIPKIFQEEERYPYMPTNVPAGKAGRDSQPDFSGFAGIILIAFVVFVGVLFFPKQWVGNRVSLN